MLKQGHDVESAQASRDGGQPWNVCRNRSVFGNIERVHCGCTGRHGKFELALVDFSESLRHDPNSASAYTGLGNAYRGLKLFGSAITAHSEAIRLKPDDAGAYSNRGNVFHEMN